MPPRFPQRVWTSKPLGQRVDGVDVFIGRDHGGAHGSPARSLIASLACALEGLGVACRTQRNFRLQLGLGALALTAAVVLHLPTSHLLSIVALTALVLCAELLNTALEFLVDDYVGTTFDPSVKRIKDLSAAAVLVVCLGASAIGLGLFLPSLRLLALGLRGVPHAGHICAGFAALILVGMGVVRARRRTSQSSPRQLRRLLRIPSFDPARSPHP